MASDHANKMRVVGTRSGTGLAGPASVGASPDPVAAPARPELPGRAQPGFTALPAILFIVAAAVGGALISYLQAKGIVP